MWDLFHLDGQVVVPQRKTKILLVSQVAREWLTDYTKKYGDNMPDSHQIHLPCCLTRRAVYQMYEKFVMTQGSPPLSESHFYRMWRDEFSHVCIPLVRIIIEI